MSDYIDFRGTIAATIERDQARHPARITIDMVPGYSPRAITNTLTAADLEVIEYGSTRCEATGDLTDDQFTALCLALYRAECVRSFTIHSTPR